MCIIFCILQSINQLQKVAAEDAHKLCCSIGMRLLSFETKEETETARQFFQQISELNSLFLSLFYGCIFLLDLSGLTEFWTSAVHIDCHFRFKWCATGGTLLRNDSRWQAKRIIFSVLWVAKIFLIGLPPVQISTQRINFVCTQPLTFLRLPLNQFYGMVPVQLQKMLYAR